MTLQDKYIYETQVAWTGRRTGKLTAESLPELELSAPLEFAGDPGKWTPEHMLLGAAAGCLMTTFLAIAEMSKLPVEFFTMRAAARLEKVPGEGYRFTGITFFPEIGVASEDIERAHRLLGKAEKNCFITNSLKATVQVESHISAAQPALMR